MKTITCKTGLNKIHFRPIVVWIRLLFAIFSLSPSSLLLSSSFVLRFLCSLLLHFPLRYLRTLLLPVSLSAFLLSKKCQRSFPLLLPPHHFQFFHSNLYSLSPLSSTSTLSPIFITKPCPEQTHPTLNTLRA